MSSAKCSTPGCGAWAAVGTRPPSCTAHAGGGGGVGGAHAGAARRPPDSYVCNICKGGSYCTTSYKSPTSTPHVSHDRILRAILRAPCRMKPTQLPGTISLQTARESSAAVISGSRTAAATQRRLAPLPFRHLPAALANRLIGSQRVSAAPRPLQARVLRPTLTSAISAKAVRIARLLINHLPVHHTCLTIVFSARFSARLVE